MNIDHFLSFWGHHLIRLAVWTTLTLSLNLINGFCGLFSLGHQGFWMIGAYAAGMTVVYMDGSAAGFALSFVAGIAAASVFGLIVGLPCLRLKGDYLAIATLGFSEILRNLVQNSKAFGESLGFSVPNVVRAHFSRNGFYWFYLVFAWAVAIATLIILRRLIHSAHGRAIQAIRDDERAAELVGVNLTYYKMLVFITGAAFAGLAGAVFANYEHYVTPEDYNFNQGVLMVVMVVLGGMGSFFGTILATALLYFVQEVLRLYLPLTEIPVFWDPTQGGRVNRQIKDLWQVFYSLMFIVIVLLRPQGIMGNWKFRRKFRSSGAPPSPSNPDPKPAGGAQP